MKEIRQRGGIFQAAAVFTLGAAAGSLLSLLYAPASGQVTRRRLALKARQAQRALQRRLGQTQRVLIAKAGEVRDAATEWVAEHVPHGNGRHPLRRREVRHA